MAYKGTHYSVNNCFDVINRLKDFLVACGWQLVGPTDTEAHRIAQDDKHAKILGWFLNSNGEDGNKDLHVHLSTTKDYNTRSHTWWYDWLTAGITAVQTDNIPVQDATSVVGGAVVSIDDEQILVGSVDTSGSPHYLNGCVRGYGPTTAAAHDAGDVVSLLYNNGSNYLRPLIDMYIYRDLVNPIAGSSGTISWSLGTTGNADPMTGLDNYNANGRTFKNMTLIKVVGGTHDGKMRWVTDDDGAGRYTWTKFKTAPGAYHAQMISNGWHLCSGSKQQLVGTYSGYKTSTPYGIISYSSTVARDMWVYGNKDGFALVYKNGTTYRCWYYGAYVPFASPLYTTANAVGGGDISAGTQTLEVGNTDLFAVGGKYRIIAQDYRDWGDNWDRSSDTSMGASPGDWANMEADELAQECLIVDSVDDVAGTITIQHPLIFSYRSGAIIGEDPRPTMSYCNRSDNSQYREQWANAQNYTGSGTALHASGKDRFRTDRPCHRRRDRCYAYGTSWNAWQGDGGYDYYGGSDSARIFMQAYSSNVLSDQENYTDKLLLSPFSLGFDDGYDRENYGSFRRAFGIIPIVRKMSNSLGAADEDTVKVPWNGKMEDFRIFYDDGSSQWLCLGPEIWP